MVEDLESGVAGAAVGRDRVMDDAVGLFRELLKAADASALLDLLVRGQQSAGLWMKGRPLTRVLGPRLVEAGHQRQVHIAGELVSRVAHRVAAHAVGGGAVGEAVRAAMAVSPLERALACVGPPVDPAWTHTRLDGFGDGAVVQFVEYNADNVSCAISQEILAGLYLDTPVMAAFTDHYQVDYARARAPLVQLLLSAWRAAGEPGASPAAAIVDWPEGAWVWEFDAVRADLEAAGVPTLICTPDQVSYDGNRLYGPDPEGRPRPITLVFRRAMTSDLLHRYGEQVLTHPLIRSAAEGACAIVNPFASYLVHKKSLWAALTDDRVLATLPDQEADGVRHHLPWTRVLRPGPTLFHGERIELLEFALAHRQQLVLKPDDGYAGGGIALGWQHPPADWETLLQQALATPHVIQERIPLPTAAVSTLQDGHVHMDNRHHDNSPFLFGTTAAGTITRTSASPLVNVTTGSDLVPTIEITPRHPNLDL